MRRRWRRGWGAWCRGGGHSRCPVAESGRCGERYRRRSSVGRRASRSRVRRPAPIHSWSTCCRASRSHTPYSRPTTNSCCDAWRKGSTPPITSSSRRSSFPRSSIASCTWRSCATFGSSITVPSSRSGACCIRPWRLWAGERSSATPAAAAAEGAQSTPSRYTPPSRTPWRGACPFTYSTSTLSSALCPFLGRRERRS